MEYDGKQLEAINLCCNLSKRIVSVTGEAGTGKTTIIREVYSRLSEIMEKRFKVDEHFDITKYIVLVAPTGKAAKRIYEATGIPAMTIHRLLEYPTPGEVDENTGKPTGSSDPKRNRHNRLDQYIVICDEYAMVSYELHRNLIDALPNGGCIRMFGDCNQLEPIEESAYLKGKPSQFEEMLVKFPSVKLETIHRQEDDSGIITNSHKINRGIMPLQTQDFKIYFTNQSQLPTTVICSLIDNDQEYFTPSKQILSPARVSWVGTEKLNQMVQMRRFGKRIEEGYPIERHKWIKNQDFCLFVGDKVIFTKNNYDLGVFNGETGVVTSAELYGDITIDFGDKVVRIPTTQMILIYGKMVEYNPQKDIDLAYVITTHKAQGSEYKEVTYIIDRSLIYMCCRKNLYTAITRAREKVNIVTDQKTFIFSLKNVKNPYSK